MNSPDHALISVIIPTLNEAQLLEATLTALAENPVPHEVLIVDGGSSDGTQDLARCRGVEVLTCPEPQRSLQMNAGRQSVRGETLLFLHADTLLAPTALAEIQRTLSDQAFIGGGFARRYATSSRFLHLTCLLAEWRCRSFGWFLGDQAIFVRAKTFDLLDGFREMPLFEDLDFSRRMKSCGRLATLRPPVVSSPRRFSRGGPIRTTLSDLRLTFRYLRSSRPASGREL